MEPSMKNKLLWDYIEMQKMGNGGYAVKYSRKPGETVMGAYEFNVQEGGIRGRYVLDHAQGDFFCFYYTPMTEKGLEFKDARLFKVKPSPSESSATAPTNRKEGEIIRGIRKQGKSRYTISHVEGDTVFWDLV